MPNEQIGIDIPAGKFARISFSPVTEEGKPAKIDGPLEALVLGDDPNAAQVAVGGKDGLVIDIKLPDTEGALAQVEVDGDNDTDPTIRSVITTIISLRRLGEVPGKAVSLGAKPENVAFLTADQFGQFPT